MRAFGAFLFSSRNFGGTVSSMALIQASSGMSMRRDSTPISTTFTALGLPACSASFSASTACTSAMADSFSTMPSGYSIAPVITGIGQVFWVLVNSTPPSLR